MFDPEACSRHGALASNLWPHHNRTEQLGRRVGRHRLLGRMLWFCHSDDPTLTSWMNDCRFDRGQSCRKLLSRSEIEPWTFKCCGGSVATTSGQWLTATMEHC